MRTDLDVYVPGDGVTPRSHVATYKGIKEFKVNTTGERAGTITFKTQKHGIITTPCLWRLKENLPDDAPVGGGDAENAAPAGNQARVRRGY